MVGDVVAGGKKALLRAAGAGRRAVRQETLRRGGKSRCAGRQETLFRAALACRCAWRQETLLRVGRGAALGGKIQGAGAAAAPGGAGLQETLIRASGRGSGQDSFAVSDVEVHQTFSPVFWNCTSNWLHVSKFDTARLVCRRRSSTARDRVTLLTTVIGKVTTESVENEHHGLVEESLMQHGSASVAPRMRPVTTMGLKGSKPWS